MTCVIWTDKILHHCAVHGCTFDVSVTEDLGHHFVKSAPSSEDLGQSESDRIRTRSVMIDDSRLEVTLTGGKHVCLAVCPVTADRLLDFGRSIDATSIIVAVALSVYLLVSYATHIILNGNRMSWIRHCMTFWMNRTSYRSACLIDVQEHRWRSLCSLCWQQQQIKRRGASSSEMTQRRSWSENP